MPTWVLTNATTGVALTDAVDAGTLLLTDRAYASTSRLSFRVRDEAGTLVIANEHEIVLQEDGVKAFAGLVKVLRKTDTGVAGQRIYDLECQDYTTLLSEDVVDAGVRANGETDKARIAWLFSTFGGKGVNAGTAAVVQLNAAMPDQDFTGKTLHQCLTMIAEVTGGSFYVDYDKVLHYFTTESNAAPFGLSDAPNGSTTFGYEDFAETSDSVDQINAVYIIGNGVSGWRPASPPALATRRATVLVDDTITTLTQLNARGDSLLSAYSVLKKPSTLKTHKPGLRAGMYVQVTHSGWGISAVSYRVAALSARLDTKDRLTYEVAFGNAPVDFASILTGITTQVGQAQAAAVSAAANAAKVNDLSAGGGNLVPNSSFEDGTGWSVGSHWTIGFAPTGGQLPFHWEKVARLVTSSQTAGDLITPYIAVSRLDDYWFSLWHFVRSRSSGTLRIAVLEYDAANALLATNSIDLTAVDTAWVRKSLHFANTPSSGIIAWQPTTAKVRIRINTTGSSTLTADVDGVQLERGKLITAYAPAPYELLEESVGETKIAPDAITTPKVAANAIVSGKIAAAAIGTAQLAANAVTADKIAAGAVTIGAMARKGQNLLDNSSFEIAPAVGFGVAFAATTDGQPHWLAGTVGCVQYAVNSAARTGDKVLRVAGNGSANLPGLTSYNIPVTPGKLYRLAGWGRRGGGSTDGRLRLDTLDATGAVVATGVISLAFSGTSVEYREGGYTVPTNGSVSFLRVIAYLDDATAPASSEIVHFDDIELVETTAALANTPQTVVIDDAGITIKDEFSQTVLTALGFFGSWEDFVNLGLYNARFGVGIVGAIGAGRTSALPYWDRFESVNTTTSFKSGGGIRATYSGLGGSAVVSDRVPVRPLTEYGVAFIRQINRAAGNLAIDAYIRWYDSTGALIGTAEFVGRDGPHANNIALGLKQIGSRISPAGARWASLEIHLDQSLTHSASNWIDVLSASLREATVEEIAVYHQKAARTSADLTLTTSNQAAVSVPAARGRRYLVTYCADFDVTAAGVGVCAGVIQLDGTTISGSMPLHFAPATTGRQTVAQSWVVDVPDGDRTTDADLALAVRKTVNAGTAVAKVNSTAISAVPIG